MAWQMRFGTRDYGWAMETFSFGATTTYHLPQRKCECDHLFETLNLARLAKTDNLPTDTYPWSCCRFGIYAALAIQDRLDPFGESSDRSKQQPFPNLNLQSCSSFIRIEACGARRHYQSIV
jgi:hypothetical protein